MRAIKLTIPMFLGGISFHNRIRATLAHLGGTIAVAALSYLIVFYIWYPQPFDQLAGGRELYWLIVGIDLILGPSLTFVVFDTTKGLRSLVLDLVVIIGFQLAALLYGLHTTYTARPVALVFEVDRFRVIAATDVRTQELSAAPSQWKELPNFSIWTLGTRSSRSSETLDSIEIALAGYDVAQRPSYWQDYDLSRTDVIKRARSLAALYEQVDTSGKIAVSVAASKAGVPLARAKYLPLMSRFRSWIVVLDEQGAPAGYAAVEGF